MQYFTPTKTLRFHQRALTSLALGSVLAFAACSSEDPPAPDENHAGAGSGGSAGSGTSGSSGTTAKGGSAGNTGTAGTATAGTAGNTSTAGTAGTGPNGGTGGTPAAGTGGTGGSAGTTTAGNGGTAGSTGGSSGDGAGGTTSGNGGGGTGGTPPMGWTCPSGVTGTPTLGTAMRVTAVPPPDAFNMQNGTFGNIEGPVWIDDSLYVSEMASDSYDQANGNIKKSRILRVTAAGQASVFIADSGSNGLAVDGDGNIVAAVHKDGSITRYPLPDGQPSVLAGMFMNTRFNSPNDLAIRTDGNIYFTDPSFQAPNTPPQSQTRAYRIPPGGEPTPIPNGTMPDMFNNPNGITLSLAEDFLYVAASNGRRYPVMADGSLDDGQDFAATSGGDGMAIDCAGNLYVAKSNSANVVVYDPDGDQIGMIAVSDVQAVTNVAFGGTDHKTLYITGLGNNKGLWQATSSIPGRPY